MGGGFDQRERDDVRHRGTAFPEVDPGKRTLTEQLVLLVHTAPARQVAERDRLNAVITVVARSPNGAVVARWRAPAVWVGSLPMSYRGTRTPWAWDWSDSAARATRIHTRPDGTGGESVERWATAHGAETVDIVAMSPESELDPTEHRHIEHAHGGARAHTDGNGEARHGSALGVKDGSEGGRFGGEGKPGDDGVTMGGGWFGGVIAVPEALKGVVDVLLIVDAGDIAGAGRKAFTALGKEAAKMSAAALRELVAREARVICRSAVEATAEELPQWLALPGKERERAIEIAFNEQMRRYFQGFGEAARDAERVALRAGNAAQESLVVARIGAEAAEVEPVAGRLPRNHQYAGKEFPRELLPPKYQEQGLRFKPTGYPDFEPYAMTLPDGKKTVNIEHSGSQCMDRALANKAAKLEHTPDGYTWHHVEDEGTMMLVPTELHRRVSHTGGRAMFKHRTGVSYGN